MSESESGCPAACRAPVRDQIKGEAGIPPPLRALWSSAGSTGPGGRMVSTVYSAAASVIGTTDTKVRPLAFARNSTWPSTLANRVWSVSYTHLRAHETGRNLVCRLL